MADPLVDWPNRDVRPNGPTDSGFNICSVLPEGCDASHPYDVDGFWKPQNVVDTRSL